MVNYVINRQMECLVLRQWMSVIDYVQYTVAVLEGSEISIFTTIANA